MDVHPPKNGIFIAIDPYPYERIEIYLKIAMGDEKVEKCGGWLRLPPESFTKREMAETLKPLDLHQLHWYQTGSWQTVTQWFPMV